jgi:hypothetical protein
MKRDLLFTDAQWVMKLKGRGIIAMTVLVGVILAGGCVSDDPPVAAVVTPVTTSIATPVAAMQTNTMTPVPTVPGCADPPLNLWTDVPESYKSATPLPPKQGTRVSSADLFGTPTLSWKSYRSSMQYRINPGWNLVKSNGIWRREIAQEVYRGKTASHVKDTRTFSTSEPKVSPEQLTVTDTWYDEKNIMVSQHRKVSINDDVGEDADMPVKNPEPDCSGDLFTPRYEYLGIDPVTVPSGSYPNAMKYTTKYGSTGTISYWFATGVPVEVKKVIEDPENEELDTIELTGWG